MHAAERRVKGLHACERLERELDAEKQARGGVLEGDDKEMRTRVATNLYIYLDAAKRHVEAAQVNGLLGVMTLVVMCATDVRRMRRMNIREMRGRTRRC